MKSIFLGGSKIGAVYHEDTVSALSSITELEKRVYTKEDLLSYSCKDAEYIFSTWGMPKLSEEEIAEYLPSLKAVFYAAGSVQHFAEPFLKKGIKIFSAWGANAVPVAEYAASCILLANKGFFSCSSFKGSRSYSAIKAASTGFDGNYKVYVGILGAGMIGRLVIERLKKSNIDIKVYDPFLDEAAISALGAEKATLEEIFSSCQTISNHMANKMETIGILNYSLFSKMKENAAFINTGRGAQVNENDLCRAMKDCPSRCAILDVTYPEPPKEDSPLHSLENIILTPHIAGSLGNEVWRMGEYMKDEFFRLLNGEKTKYEVTLEMLERMA